MQTRRQKTPRGLYAQLRRNSRPGLNRAHRGDRARKYSEARDIAIAAGVHVHRLTPWGVKTRKSQWGEIPRLRSEYTVAGTVTGSL